MQPISDVREISRLAYGFKASKALMVALEFNIFGRISDRPKSLPELADETGLAANRLETLLIALASLGLLSKSGEVYRNAPACQEYLVPGTPAYFGDYFSLQTNQFIFPAYAELASVVRGVGGTAKWGEYRALMVAERIAQAGFSDVSVRELIPGLTKLALASKKDATA